STPPPPPALYTLSLHDALPISLRSAGRRGLPGLRPGPPAGPGRGRPAGPARAQAAARGARPGRPGRVPGRARLRPRGAPFPARLRAGPAFARPVVVHGRGDGAVAGLPRGRAAGGRRLAGPVAPLGTGPRPGVRPAGDDRRAAHPPRVRPRRRLTRRAGGPTVG